MENNVEKKWYVVNTYSGHENKVKINLERRIETMNMQDYIFRVIVAEHPVPVLKDGLPTDKIKMKNTYPGYLFIEMYMTDEAWYVIKNVRGVTGFVGSGAKPTPLTEDEVQQLGVEKHEIVVNYAEGDSVKITDGPLTSFVGVVDMLDVDKNKVRVIVSMFGRETPVELELDQVETVNS